MAKHWSTYTGGVTERQARALDAMAIAHGYNDGMDLLCEVGSYSRSKVTRLDRLSLAPTIDACFKKYGAAPEPATTSEDPRVVRLRPDQVPDVTRFAIAEGITHDAAIRKLIDIGLSDKFLSDEFRRLLCRALHLPEDTSVDAMLALVETAYHFYLLNRPAEVATSIEALDIPQAGDV
jgi:hypothetical protein